LKLIKVLVAHGAKINDNVVNGQNAMEFAAIVGNADVLRLLHQLGGDVTVQDESKAIPLFAAVRTNHLEAVRTLVQLGGNVNVKNVGGLTPLMLAAQLGNATMVRALLDGKSHKISNVTEAITQAAAKQHVGIVQLLCRVGGHISDQAVIHAAKEGHLDLLTELLKLGGCATATSVNKDPALLFAVVGGHTAVVKLLVANGADVKSHPLLLHHARGAAMIKLLCKLGFDVNAANPATGATPIFSAASNNRAEEICALVKLGGKCSTPANNGLTPFQAAAFIDAPAAVKVLAEYTENVDVPNKNGVTAMMTAVSKNSSKAVRMLGSLGAKVRPMRDGKSMLEYSAASGNVATVCALIDLGVDWRHVTPKGPSVLTVLDDPKVNGEATRKKLVRMLHHCILRNVLVAMSSLELPICE
jgi:ankyrin repeat protein